MNKNKFTTITIGIIVAIILGVFTSFLRASLVFGGAFYVLIITLSIIEPIKTNAILISIWFIIKGTLTTINIGEVPASQAVIPVIVIPLAIAIIVRGKLLLKKSEGNKVILIYGILVIFTFLGVVIAPIKQEAVVIYSRVIIGFMYLLLFSKGIAHNKERTVLIYSIVTLAMVSAIITILGFVLSTMFGIDKIGNIIIAVRYYGNVYRPAGTTGGAVTAGILLYTLYIYVLFVQNFKKNKKYSFFIIILIIGGFVTLTRTVILSFLSAWLLIYLFYYAKQKKGLKLFISAGIIAVLVFLVMPEEVKISVMNRFVDFSGNNIEDFGAGRVGIWNAIFLGVKNNLNIFSFMHGFGIDAARHFVMQYSTFLIEDATHNDYMDMFISSGFIGFSLMLLWVFNIIKLIGKITEEKLKIFVMSNFAAYFLIVMMLSNTNYSTEARWSFLIVLSLFIDYLDNKQFYIIRQEKPSKRDYLVKTNKF